MITTPEGLIQPEIELIGTDNNAFSIIALCARALSRAGNDRKIVDAFRAEAMSGDYDHVLQTAMAYCEVVG